MKGLSRYRALPFPLLMLLLAPILATVLLDGGESVGARLTGVAAGSPTYTVTQVRTDLARDHAWWEGRTVRVRGLIYGCVPNIHPGEPPPCQDWQPLLTDAAVPLTPPLPLAWAGLDPLLAVVRRAPLVGSLLPAPQAVLWDQVASYRVQLRALAGNPCGMAPCYEALLLDAVP